VISHPITTKVLAELKKAISCMPKPTKRKIKAAPILPRTSSEPESIVEDDEEEAYWMITGFAVSEKSFLLLTICFNDLEEKEWALETWNSVLYKS